MNGGVARARGVGHDLEQIEVITHTVGRQKQGSIGVKLQGHHGLVVSHKVCHNTGQLVCQIDFILIRVVANLKNIQDSDYAFLHVIGSTANAANVA